MNSHIPSGKQLFQVKSALLTWWRRSTNPKAKHCTFNFYIPPRVPADKLKFRRCLSTVDDHNFWWHQSRWLFYKSTCMFGDFEVWSLWPNLHTSTVVLKCIVMVIHVKNLRRGRTLVLIFGAFLRGLSTRKFVSVAKGNPQYSRALPSLILYYCLFIHSSTLG